MSLLPEQFAISTLGPCERKSPLSMSTQIGDGIANFVPDDLRMLFNPKFRASQLSAGSVPEDEQRHELAFEVAGPRERIFFDPTQTRAAIVTCGGLCPGMNNVIRSLVFELNHNYGVHDILGIRYGYQGLNPEQAQPPQKLTSEWVESIHHFGGTILGTSRGPQDPTTTVDYLEREQINVLFCIGGDGTQRGAHGIAMEIAHRELSIAVVGIPKTIDNDIKYCWRTFGFVTAVAEAEKAIDRAHVEAKSVRGGVGLVKLMGREAGFITAAATLASGEANFALIPEVPFELHGPGGFLTKLQQRLEKRDHAVAVVAEGAGQQLLANSSENHDASGNRRLNDIGPFLKQQINDHFKAQDLPVSVKYFDPSYHIRSVPAGAADSLFCEQLARQAVHAAMAGKTDLLIGLWYNQLTHVPLPLSTGAIKRLSPESQLWSAVLSLTGQEG
jgi:6-phosphofructokinase 1